MKSDFEELKRTINRLHGPQGCAWDKKQTHRSILPHLREEVDELASAVESGDTGNMEEELGDLLLHVMFHAKIAQKAGKFGIDDVIRGLVRKLKRRHPHVFGRKKCLSARQIIRNWEKIKAREKAGKK